MTPTDLTDVRYTVVDHLPGRAVVLAETTEDGCLVIYLSREHSREVVAEHLGPLMTAYCRVNRVQADLALVV